MNVKADSNNDTDRNQIEEYKELRQEIRLYLSERNSIKKFAFTLTLAVTGFIFHAKINNIENIILLLCSCLFILIIWYQENRRIKAVFRIGAYIRHIIEPYVDGLNYETHAISYQEETNIRYKINKLYACLDFPFMFLVLFGLALYFFMILEKSKNLIMGKDLIKCLTFISILIVFVLFIIMMIKTIIIILNGRKKEDDHWIKLKNNSSLKETS